jgi:CTP synthase
VTYEDSYKSLREALTHGGLANGLHVEFDWVEADAISDYELDRRLEAVDGILVPGGFGIRGVEGMVKAAEYARTHKVPYFGICLGMQIAVIEIARNLCAWKDADSTEFNNDTHHKVFVRLRDLEGVEEMGGTMRLGSYACRLSPGSRAARAYGASEIRERHRHRYEFNPEFRKGMEERGLLFTGISPDGKFIEIVEFGDHPWFLACQFHPEFKSKPMSPHPLFRDFIAAAHSHARSGREVRAS